MNSEEKDRKTEFKRRKAGFCDEGSSGIGVQRALSNDVSQKGGISYNAQGTSLSFNLSFE